MEPMKPYLYRIKNRGVYAKSNKTGEYVFKAKREIYLKTSAV